MSEVPAGDAPVVDGNFQLATTKELAEKHKVEYGVMAGVLKFLESKKLIAVDSKRPTATGKGRATTVYRAPKSVSFDL